MKGFRVLGLGFSLTALIFTVFLSLYPIPQTLYPTFAAESTPSSTVKEKLEALKQEIASKAAKLKQEINKNLSNRAFIGVIKGKSVSSITLATKGGSKIINVTEDTTYQNSEKPKSKLTLDGISEEDRIAALGDVDDQGVLTARRIVLLPNPETEEITKTVIWGQIVSAEELITIKDKTSQNLSLALDSKSEIKKGEEEIDQSDLTNGDIVIATGEKNKQGIFEVSFIFVASSSATPN